MNYIINYNYDKYLGCGIIKFNEHLLLLDFEDLFEIINFQKNFIYYDENKLYPYYLRHNQKISFLDFIYKFDNSNITYTFKNQNPFDIRRNNVVYYHIYNNIVSNEYNVTQYIDGHYSLMGKDAYVMKNPLWKINENGKEYLLMYCEKDTICKLCKTSYQKILDFELSHNNGEKLTFGKGSNGYILSHFNDSGLSIHQIIIGCYGNGKGTNTISVDHIDQDPLNNTWDNLRISTREEQEQNSKGIKEGTKKERKKNAKDLPEGITQDMMKKYVVYYREFYDKEKTKEREFFKIEKHPKLNKHWMTSKSAKVSIEDKLKHANKVIDDLENNIYPEKEEAHLPKYVSLLNIRDKPHLAFDKKHNDKRLTLKMGLPEEYNIQEQIILLKLKVNEKYGVNFID